MLYPSELWKRKKNKYNCEDPPVNSRLIHHHSLINKEADFWVVALVLLGRKAEVTRYDQFLLQPL